MGDPVNAMRKAREAYTRALKEYLEAMEGRDYFGMPF